LLPSPANKIMAADKREYQILVIEDNPGDFALIEDFLFEQIEAPVISSALNFKDASEQLSNSENRFDIVLLDLSLPDKIGEPLINGIVDLCPNTPVIVLTGYSDFNFSVKSISLGVSDYMLKDELTSLSLYKSILYSTERKKTIAELAESEKKYSELFHLTPLPMWVFELGTLKYLDVNNAAIKQYGYSREEFLSMTVNAIKPSDDILEMDELLNDENDPQSQRSPENFRHVKKNGEVINVDIQSNFIDFKGKRAKVVIASDITERLKYVAAIESQNERLREISWIKSHIVRAPLARIMGLIPLIKDLKEHTTEREMMFDFLMISANELDDIIRDITDKTIVPDDKEISR